MTLSRGHIYRSLIQIILVASIGVHLAQSLWIPLPRSPNRISHMIGKVRIQRPESMAISTPIKRDTSLLESLSVPNVESQIPNDGQTVEYSYEQESDQRQRERTENETDRDHDLVDVHDHWPITPRACLVLMKILYAQTADIIERGNTDDDFYEAASYYQPAARTLFKCMEMADRGNENGLVD